jgi:hypothetical protein
MGVPATADHGPECSIFPFFQRRPFAVAAPDALIWQEAEDQVRFRRPSQATGSHRDFPASSRHAPEGGTWSSEYWIKIN